MYLTPDAYAGVSITSLNNSKIIDNANSDQRLNTFINVIGGRTFRLNEKWALKPSGLVRVSANGPVQFDANFGLRYANKFWLTTTYRYQFGGVISGHYFITDQFHIGYSYDLPFNTLLSQQSGTHEIFIGYDFNIHGTKSRIDQGF
jgi:type IX secretion system PorP/SprF family membrane protein